ncbi:MAG TPA: lysylphosphatidylglycerol synthase transmembrane domain-containing protein [Thermoanaerobaculia bacterium]|nr:lysylphosphatidylglycerol synthase transmembrane domain-containing protein [Thermoanaerobaculia bacterium]
MTLPEPDQKSRLRAWGMRSFQAVVIVFAGYFTYRFVTHSDLSWSKLAERVAAARASYVTLGVALLLLRYGLWDWRFRQATRLTLGYASGPFLGFFVLMASAALNLITPTARVIGGLMRARYFARGYRRPFGLLYGVVLWDQVAHHTVMSICTWIVFSATAFYLGRPWLGWISVVALVAAAAVLWIWGRRRGPFEQNPIVRFLAGRAARDEGKLDRFFAHGHEAVGVFVRLLSSGPLQVQASVLGAAYFLVNIAAQWAMFQAIGAPVSPFVVVAVVSLGTAVGTLTGTPGGMGTTEVAMMASFKLMGVDAVVAAAGILLYRGLHYAGVLAVGLPALTVLELRPKGKSLHQGEEQERDDRDNRDIRDERRAGQQREPVGRQTVAQAVSPGRGRLGAKASEGEEIQP